MIAFFVLGWAVGFVLYLADGTEIQGVVNLVLGMPLVALFVAAGVTSGALVKALGLGNPLPWGIAATIPILSVFAVPILIFKITGDFEPYGVRLSDLSASASDLRALLEQHRRTMQ